MLAMMRRLPDIHGTPRCRVLSARWWIVASDNGLRAILWEEYLNDLECQNVFSNLQRENDHPMLEKTRQQLAEYFAGVRRTFDIPLILDGTEFSERHGIN